MSRTFEDFEDLAEAMYRSGRFVDSSDVADAAVSAYEAGEYFYAVVSMVEFAADHQITLGEFRSEVERLIVPLVDADDVDEFREYLAKVPNRSAA
ncbi:hypothetical protein G8767_17105 [Rhodococcus sp. IC4_135]|uniref:hypothetical protein n=1 Tax=Rhodococcus sp. IC4_135 TaxID=2715537 RepID=UPI00141DAEB9|nr:hypothetical protein [Rhodococcus sp. IC4_135]